MQNLQEKKEIYFKGFINYIEMIIENAKKENKLPFEKEAQIFYYKQILGVARQFERIAENIETVKNLNENKEIERLKKENEDLKKQIERNKCDRIKTAHEIISEIISEKVISTVRSNLSKHTKTALKREVLEALKWKLQVRYANDLKDEHVEEAKEFIKNYKIDDFYLIER
ncbi:MAG: hypothetical protein HFJ20_01420 [Clostridia bacterium]|nr:hypothetical protein [Clostridia bacterium]